MKSILFFIKAISACSVFMAGFLITISSVQAMTWDFNDGTNQGWSVEYNTTDPAGDAYWGTEANYSGNPAIGRPMAYGPIDNVFDDTGSISGVMTELAESEYTISSFVSPVLTPQEMDTISARFIVGGMENGISNSAVVWGRIGYSISSDTSFYFGDYVALETDTTGFYNYPLWTFASTDVTDGHLVDQIFVNVYTNISLFDGMAFVSKHYVDDVITNSSTTPPGPGPDPVPEPGTLTLLGLGILGIAGIGRKKTG